MKLENFTPDTLSIMDFGYKRRFFYVHHISESLVEICSPEWLCDSGIWFSIEELEVREAIIMCATKKKWFWKFLPFKDTVCPYYAPKKQI